MKLPLVTLAALSLALVVGLSDGARILAIVAIPSFSHQIAYQALWKTLLKRGHEIVLVTTDAMQDTGLTNLTQFEIKEAYELIEKIDFLNERRVARTWMDISKDHMIPMSKPLAELVFSHPKFRPMYAPNSGEKFDVVIVEAILTPACSALGYRFNAPVIGAYSMGLLQNFHYVVGNPILSSHPSNYEVTNINLEAKLTFWKRLKNFIRIWKQLFTSYEDIYYNQQEEIIKKYLGDAPPVRELEKNMSIVLANQQDEISFARPTVPKVINFGSLHVTDNMKPLPKDLQKFIDNAPNGFIYVSLGTNVRTEMFSKELINSLFNVFANLPVKVVWKFKGTVPKSDNVYTAQWFSQQSILAHPKVKLFVFQGGVQSTEEAVHFGVPLVGVPVLADQDMQIYKLVSIGVCKFVDILKITSESLDEAIREVLTDKSYKENMTKLSKLIKDKPQTQMEHVIWWIEYIIRNKGAPHLRTTIEDEPWYQRYDTDIIAFLSVTAYTALLLTVYIAYKTLIAVMGYESMSATSKKKKIS